jgi:hypothetical protein
MASLILHASSLALWHTLLLEAQKSSSIHLAEDLESYLVFLLMRFTQQPALASSVLGLEFLQGLQQQTELSQQHLLKEVGDKCLLYAGLFPGRAQKRRLEISYFVKLGQTAYSTLSHHHVNEALFISLHKDFPQLMDVLHATRENPGAIDLLEPTLYFPNTPDKNKH